MPFKSVVIFVIVVFISACSESNQQLSTAIQASRDGLALQRDSKPEEGREKLLDARNHYAELVANFPQNALFNNNYGWVLIKLGEYSDARELLEQAKELAESSSVRQAVSKNLQALNNLTAKET